MPVESISWDDCQNFISKLNKKTGRKFRLPTEAEWEYAARCGNKSKGYQYSGSNNISDVGWYKGNSGSKTHSVGLKQANELGVYDMTGNVWEWCQDWIGGYSSSSQTDPTGVPSGFHRVCRGGCWHEEAIEARSSSRIGYSTERNGSSGLGIRLVLSE